MKKSLTGPAFPQTICLLILSCHRSVCWLNRIDMHSRVLKRNNTMGSESFRKRKRLGSHLVWLSHLLKGPRWLRGQSATRGPPALSSSHFPLLSLVSFVTVIYLLWPFCCRLAKFKPAFFHCRHKSCLPTVCLHTQLGHRQILHCCTYLRNLCPLNPEQRELFLWVLGISLNLFLKKVLSTQFGRTGPGRPSLCVHLRHELTHLVATLLTRLYCLPIV